MEENQQNNNSSNYPKAWYHASDFPELKAEMSEEDRIFFTQAFERPDAQSQPSERQPIDLHDFDTQKRISTIAAQALQSAAEKHHPARITSGKPINLKVTCPNCNKRHCEILVSNGVFHCWSCNLGGQLPELKHRSQRNSNAVDAQYYANATPGDSHDPRKNRPKDDVRSIPSDYEEISPDVRSWLYPIYPYTTQEEQAAFQQYCHPEGLIARHPHARMPLLPHELRSLQSQVQQYCEAMHFSPDVIRKEGVMCAYLHIKTNDQRREDPQGTDLVPAIAYCNRVMGRIVNVKFRSVSRNPITGQWSKLFLQQSPTTPCAHYGIDSINPLRPGAEPIPQLIFTEGEKDRLTLMSCGFPYVLSVANGASTDLEASGEAFNDWIMQAKEIIVCGDKDKPGRMMEKKLLTKYADRAKVVQLPDGTKDISELRERFGPQEVRHVISQARDLQNLYEYNIDDHVDDIINVISGFYDHGYAIGMGPLTDAIFHPTSSGGLMIVTGIPNSGKTDFLNCMMTHLMFSCQKRVGFLSFELPDKAKHVSKIASIALGVANAEQELKGADGRLDQRKVRGALMPTVMYLSQHMVDFHTQDQEATTQLIIQIAEKRRNTHGLDYLVIDPYLFIVDESGKSSRTETERVKEMLTQIQSWSRQNGVWTIIVAHPRIQHKEVTKDFDSLNFYDISGSAQWANLADFILSVRRVNKPEEQKVYTVVEMLKVRDQEFCRPGKVYYTRQPCGRYDEREDEQACINDYSHRAVLPKDIEVWTGR